MPDRDPLPPPGDQANPYDAPGADLTPRPPAPPVAAADPGPYLAPAVAQRAWDLYRANLGLVVGVVALSTVIVWAYQAAGQSMEAEANLNSTMGFVAQCAFHAAGFVLQVWLTCGQTLAMLRVARGEPGDWNDLFRGGPFVPRFLGATILYTLGLAVCVLLPILPAAALMQAGLTGPGLAVGAAGLFVGAGAGVWYAVRFYHFAYLIIDQDAGVLGSLRGSFRLTRGRTLELAGLWVVGVAVALAGLALCVVGILWTSSWTYLMFACCYVALCSQSPGMVPWGGRTDETDES